MISLGFSIEHEATWLNKYSSKSKMSFLAQVKSQLRVIKEEWQNLKLRLTHRHPLGDPVLRDNP